ncbi:hypothetical protein ABPG72_016702 [Tetrahymena utriculariae]
MTDSTAIQGKPNWIDLIDKDDILKAQSRTEISTYIREKDGANPNQKIRETVKIEKRIFPIKKIAMARKNMKKFGDVIDVPIGKHKQGDYTACTEVNIETQLNADKGEIDIVNKLIKINTQSVKMKKDQQKLEQVQNAKDTKNTAGQAPQNNDFIEVTDKSKKSQPKTLDQIKFENDNEEYTVEITNILSFYNAKTEEKIQEEEKNFRQFLEEFCGKNSHINKYQVRFPKNKKTKELMSKAFVTFYDRNNAENLIDEIDGIDYGASILSADWARQRTGGRR